MRALIFDCETTGLTSTRLLRDQYQPSVIEFYGELVDLETGEVLETLEHLIRPLRPIPKEASEICHITDEMLVDKPTFKDVAASIVSMIERAPLVISHNLSFDMEVLDIEAARLNYAIKWPRGLCTVEQTVWLEGHRLSLTKLHGYFFVESFSDKHRAKTDTEALTQCARELFAKGWLNAQPIAGSAASPNGARVRTVSDEGRQHG